MDKRRDESSPFSFFSKMSNYPACETRLLLSGGGIYSSTCRKTRRRRREETDKIKKIGKADLFILNELGYIPFTKKGSQFLFLVISKSYEHQSIISLSQTVHLPHPPIAGNIDTLHIKETRGPDVVALFFVNGDLASSTLTCEDKNLQSHLFSLKYYEME